MTTWRGIVNWEVVTEPLLGDDGTVARLDQNVSMHVREVLSADAPQILELGNVLKTQGANLMTTPLACLSRGTPVYVEADADLLIVQRRMVEALARFVPVLDGSKLLGLVDLVELARISDRMIRLAVGRSREARSDSSEVDSPTQTSVNRKTLGVVLFTQGLGRGGDTDEAAPGR
jgi:hypothetical protein